MLKLWSIPNDNDKLTSQFDQNYLADVNLEKFSETTGVKYYHVTNTHALSLNIYHLIFFF